MMPAGPASLRRGIIARLCPDRKAVSLYLPLVVIVGGWLVSLLTLSRMRLVAGFSLMQLVQYAAMMAVVTWGGILLLLKIQGEGFGSVGLGRGKCRGSLVPGVLLGVGVAVLEVFVLMPLARRFWPESHAVSLNHWFEGPWVVPLWGCLACIAGLKEELARSFVLTRFEKAFGRKGLIISLLLTTVMFGMGHLYQGLIGVVVTGIVGLLYALIYLRRRSCWEAAIAHATYDMFLAGMALVLMRANGAPHQ